MQEYLRESTPDEIATEMDVDVDYVLEIIKIAQESVSLETPIDDDLCLGDFVEDCDAPNFFDIALNIHLKDGKARTLEEVGKNFKRTRERIRQIEAGALKKLRHPKLKDFWD